MAGQGEPWFVADKDIANNRLIVVQGHEHPLLLKPELNAQQLGLDRRIGRQRRPLSPAKTRYRQQDAACELNCRHRRRRLQCAFDQPQWAVTPGQSVKLLYDGDVCLGGGVIS